MHSAPFIAPFTVQVVARWQSCCTCLPVPYDPTPCHCSCLHNLGKGFAQFWLGTMQGSFTCSCNLGKGFAQLWLGTMQGSFTCSCCVLQQALRLGWGSWATKGTGSTSQPVSTVLGLGQTGSGAG
jgi:hypothetical protein